MFRPQTSTLGSPRRRGAILIVVLALLTLFAVIGLSFVFYADSEATSSRLNREAQAVPTAIPPDATLAVNTALSAIIFDTQDTGTDLWNNLRGHSLLRAMFGWTGTAGQNNVPYDGIGTFHENLNLTAFGLGNNVDHGKIINFSLMSATGAGGAILFDAEYTGHRNNFSDFQQSPSNTAYFKNPSKSYVAQNAPYTYPDLKDLYLASISPATGEVLVPSFYRDWLFNSANLTTGGLTPSTATTSGNPNWTNPQGRLFILRPRPVDQLTTQELANLGIPHPIPTNLNTAQQTKLNAFIECADRRWTYHALPARQ